MQNLKKSVKSRGIVAFAVNTDATDYVSIANQTMRLAGQVLDLPYTIITEETIKDQLIHNNRYDVDRAEFVSWKNMGRHCAYELSPYDETLVLDIDYIVQDRSLLKIFDLPWDYKIVKSASCLNGDIMPTLMGSHSLPYVWATVFAFRKTVKAKMFFDLVGRIKNNYHYYRDLFNAESRIFRNDHAFAIADIIINGFAIEDNGIPGSMLNVTQPIKSIELQENSMIIRDDTMAYVVPKMNLHIMSKAYLQSENFKQLLNQLLNVTT